MDLIKETTIQLIDEYKLKHFGETREEFINRICETRYLILSTNMKFLDIVLQIRKKYKRPFLLLYQAEKDIIQFMLKRSSEYYGISQKEIILRYTDNFDDVEERMLFRMELYKDGWKIDQIERYIYKYLLREEYPELDIEYYEYLYYNLMAKYKFTKKEKEKKSGRPSLPFLLKTYIKKKHSYKMKEHIKNKYKCYKEYQKVKSYFFTTDEIEEIKKSVTNAKIIDKVEHLKI